MNDETEESPEEYNELERKRGERIETDPNGLSANEVGAKLDQGKNRMGLMFSGFSRALEAVGGISTFGANKYSPNGWVKVDNGIERYTDAMLRHLTKECMGEERDSDSKLLHSAHLAWNALARLELQLREESVKK